MKISVLSLCTLLLATTMALAGCSSTSHGSSCSPETNDSCVCQDSDGATCERNTPGCRCTVTDDEADMSETDTPEDDVVEDDVNTDDTLEEDVIEDMADMTPDDMTNDAIEDLDTGPDGIDDMVDADADDADDADMPDMEMPTRQRYVITMQNLTTQPLGPVVAATHAPEIHMWQEGELATPGIKVVAEMGIPFGLYDEVNAVEGVTQVINRGVPMTPSSTTKPSFGPFPPGTDLLDHTSFIIEAAPGDTFSFASMLVATNDGFWGLDSVELPETGTMIYLADGWDAGTEDNTELSEHLDDGNSIFGRVMLTGDPNGNEGVVTDPPQAIARHTGIMEVGDLDLENHGFDTHIARVIITAVPEGTDAFEVLVNNISTQPLGPCVGVTHPDSLHLWEEGQLASPGIKVIAEMGVPFPFLEEAQATDNVTFAINSGLPTAPIGLQRTTFGPFPPNVALNDHTAFHVVALPGDVFSLASMLVTTNDGFWGSDSVALPTEDELVYMTMAYDAGTEENSELSIDLDDGGSILGFVMLPGDPNGNAGTVTDPPQNISIHTGIAEVGDLTMASHGWTPETPVAIITLRTLVPREDTRCLENAACP